MRVLSSKRQNWIKYIEGVPEDGGAAVHSVYREKSSTKTRWAEVGWTEPDNSKGDRQKVLLILLTSYIPTIGQINDVI